MRTHRILMPVFLVICAAMFVPYTRSAFEQVWGMEMKKVGIIKVQATEAETIMVDIKPGGCPNTLNMKSKGVVPVAVIGTETFDVTAIDTASIQLAGVSPIRSSVEDVTRPPTTEGECACTDDGGDGYPDLVLHFKAQELAKAMGSVQDGQTVQLTLVAELRGENGTPVPVQGTDCVTVKSKGKVKSKFRVQ